MTKLFQNYKRAAIEFVKAKDNYLFDQEGKAYLDFSSGIGVTNLGFTLLYRRHCSSRLKIFGTRLIYMKTICKKRSPVS